MIGNLTDEEIKDVLKENILGRIGCNDGHRTYIVPVNYVFDGKFIIANSLPGMKIEMMRENPSVCFEVDDVKNSTNWKSVIVWGEYQELSNERDRYEAMKLFIDKRIHIKISNTANSRKLLKQHDDTNSIEYLKPVIYRVVINKFTGKFERE